MTSKIDLDSIIFTQQDSTKNEEVNSLSKLPKELVRMTMDHLQGPERTETIRNWVAAYPLNAAVYSEEIDSLRYQYKCLEEHLQPLIAAMPEEYRKKIDFSFPTAPIERSSRCIKDVKKRKEEILRRHKSEEVFIVKQTQKLTNTVALILSHSIGSVIDNMYTPKQLAEELLANNCTNKETIYLTLHNLSVCQNDISTPEEVHERRLILDNMPDCIKKVVGYILLSDMLDPQELPAFCQQMFTVLINCEHSLEKASCLFTIYDLIKSNSDELIVKRWLEEFFNTNQKLSNTPGVDITELIEIHQLFIAQKLETQTATGRRFSIEENKIYLKILLQIKNLILNLKTDETSKNAALKPEAAITNAIEFFKMGSNKDAEQLLALAEDCIDSSDFQLGHQVAYPLVLICAVFFIHSHKQKALNLIEKIVNNCFSHPNFHVDDTFDQFQDIIEGVIRSSDIAPDDIRVFFTSAELETLLEKAKQEIPINEAFFQAFKARFMVLFPVQ